MPSSHSGATADRGATLDPRRKRALFRAWHRGIREMDLIMGRFADGEIGGLAERELALFEQLLELPDADVFAWVSGQAPVPAGIDGDFIARLRIYRGA